MEYACCCLVKPGPEPPSNSRPRTRHIGDIDTLCSTSESGVRDGDDASVLLYNILFFRTTTGEIVARARVFLSIQISRNTLN